MINALDGTWRVNHVSTPNPLLCRTILFVLHFSFVFFIIIYVHERCVSIWGFGELEICDVYLSVSYAIFRPIMLHQQFWSDAFPDCQPPNAHSFQNASLNNTIVVTPAVFSTPTPATTNIIRWMPFDHLVEPMWATWLPWVNKVSRRQRNANNVANLASRYSSRRDTMWIRCCLGLSATLSAIFPIWLNRKRWVRPTDDDSHECLRRNIHPENE